MKSRLDTHAHPSNGRIKKLRAAAHQLLGGWANRSVRLLAALFVLLAVTGCSSNRALSFLTPQGPVAADERTHFLVIVGILLVFVAGPIFLFIPWVLWRYRYGARKSRYTPGWKANLPLEIFTWVGPILIVIVLSFMLWNYAHKLDPYRPLASNGHPLRMQVISYDWKWLFVYPDQGIATMGVMAIPVGRPVAMKLTSATVMQSLHIPALASQIYTMGGMITQLHLQASKPGRSLGENNMYNGNGFHKERFTVIALPPEKFRAWVREVRKNGRAMNLHTYNTLSLSNTISELTTLLPQGAHDGNLYLTGVSPALFPAVVNTIKTNTRTALDRVLAAPAKSSADTPSNPSVSSTKKAP